MATPAKRSWELTEEKCFKYLLEKLAGIEDVTGYQGELPITVDNASDMNMWMFEISGPGAVEPIQVKQAQKPACSYNMGAMLKGVFADRVTAQQLAGLVMDALPIGTDEITGIQRLYYSEMPSLVRSVEPISRDKSTGGDIRVWLLTIPMIVVFNNQRS